MTESDIDGTFDSSLSPLIERISASVSHGDFARGVALEVHVDGEVAASCALGVDGLGAPISSESVFAVYCATKPVVALGIGSLVEARELSWDDCLADVLGDVAGGSRHVTIEQLLTHTAGLHLLRADEMLSRSPSDRRAVASRHTPPVGWTPATDMAYSNFLGWYWLLRVIEEITQVAPEEYVREAVTAPLGLQGSVYAGIVGDEVSGVVSRCAVNMDLTGRLPVPLLFERTPTFMRDPDVQAVGGYATLSGLCSFYDRLQGILRGDASCETIPRSLLEEMLIPRVTDRYDHVMQRTASWGLGFMVDLRRHFFGDHLGTTSFGHSGNAGSSFAFCDPTRGLSVAVLYTARVDDDFAVTVRRGGLVDQLLDLLQLV
jgi:CubicO group peptidase (beta-lactamase class C family)